MPAHAQSVFWAMLALAEQQSYTLAVSAIGKETTSCKTKQATCNIELQAHGSVCCVCWSLRHNVEAYECANCMCAKCKCEIIQLVHRHEGINLAHAKHHSLTHSV